MQSTESDVVPRPIANGLPAFLQASAAARWASQVQPSEALVCSAFAGYMPTTSRPACSFRMLIRPHGPLYCVPLEVGTASHLPLIFAKYSQTWFTWPYWPVNVFITSSTGSRASALLWTSQVGNAW